MSVDKEKYLKDASLLLTHARSRRYKDIELKTNQKSILKNVILPTFKYFQDGWKNLISGLSGSHAKSSYTTYKSHYAITDWVLHALFTSNGISRKIVNAPPDDSTRNGIMIENDDENILLKKFTDLKSLKIINKADKFRRHYGGSLIVMGINDGKEIWEELNEGGIKSIDWLKAYSRTNIYFTTINFTEDINSKNYGQPEFYTVVPKYTTPFNVHYTRVLEFKGLDVPTELDNDYRYYWGMSVIEPLWETLKKNGAALENIDQLLYEITISIYKMKGLAKLICEKRWDDIKAAINTVDLSKSTINSIIQDSEDDYKRDSLSFAGIREIMEIFMHYLAGESEIPVSRLFGKQLGGLNNEGEQETRIYYDKIQSRQQIELAPPTQRLIDLINLSKEITQKVKDPVVIYNSPWQLTQKEELEDRKMQAEIDQIYILNQVITAEEVRENRLLNGYSYEMSVEEGEIQTIVAPPEEEE